MHSKGSKHRQVTMGNAVQIDGSEIIDAQWAVRELVLRSPVSMALIDAAGSVVAVSIGFRQLFGVPDQVDLTGLNIFEDEASRRHGTARLFRKALDGEPVKFHDVQFLSPFGSFTVTKGSIFPIRDPEGFVRFAVIVHEPDAPRSEAQQRLERQKVKSLATLVGRGSRRVTDHVSTLRELLELASQSLDQGQTDTLAGIIDEAIGLTEHVTRMTGSVIDLAEAAPQTKTAVHLGDLATEVAADYRHAPIDVTIQVEKSLWNCHCDRTQMASVLSAILDNAVWLGQPTGQVRIFVQNTRLAARADLAEGNYVAIRVEDDGPGIDPEMLPHVFEPYYSTKPNAAGLGLTLARAIVQNHGGKIWMESLENHGTRVHVLVPADPTLSMVHSTLDGRNHRGPIRILVMDDNPHVRRVVVRMFESMGCLVDSVADGQDAVRMVRTATRLGRQYALVLLDIMVPSGMGGIEAMDQIRNISPGILAVATSGQYTQEDLAQYEKLGFAGFVAKPFKMADIEHAFEKLVPGGQVSEQKR